MEDFINRLRVLTNPFYYFYKLKIKWYGIGLIYCIHLVIIRIRFNFTISKLKDQWDHYKLTGAFKTQTARFSLVEDPKGTLVCLPGIQSYPIDMSNIETIKTHNVLSVRYSNLGRLQMTADINTSWQEWIEQCRDTIRLARKLTPNNVQIIAHSNGANLALLLSCEEKIDNLILIAPAVIEHPSHKWFKIILTTPIIGYILTKIIIWWYYGDWNNRHFNNNRYNQYTIPLSQVRNMWLLQDKVQSHSNEIVHDLDFSLKNLPITVIINDDDKFIAKSKEQLLVIKNYGKTTVKLVPYNHNCLQENGLLTKVQESLIYI